MSYQQDAPRAPDRVPKEMGLARRIKISSVMPVVEDQPRPVRCFVVEDSAVIRQNLVATLEEMLDVKVVGHAEDERGATAWLQRGEDIDLMIIDVFLKSGTGLEVLRRARAERPQARLVVLTNYATLDMRRRCAELGADRVFDKSAELEELLAYCADLAASGRG